MRPYRKGTAKPAAPSEPIQSRRRVVMCSVPAWPAASSPTWKDTGSASATASPSEASGGGGGAEERVSRL